MHCAKNEWRAYNESHYCMLWGHEPLFVNENRHVFQAFDVNQWMTKIFTISPENVFVIDLRILRCECCCCSLIWSDLIWSVGNIAHQWIIMQLLTNWYYLLFTFFILHARKKKIEDNKNKNKNWKTVAHIRSINNDLLYYFFSISFIHIHTRTGAFLLLAAGLCAIGSAIAMYIIQPYEAIFKWVNIYIIWKKK